jgi:hypothetical protein
VTRLPWWRRRFRLRSALLKVFFAFSRKNSAGMISFTLLFSPISTTTLVQSATVSNRIAHFHRISGVHGAPVGFNLNTPLRRGHQKRIRMNRMSIPLISMIGLLGLASASYGQVQYVKICPLYGAGFDYIPGTDVCINQQTGDARAQTTGGTWRTVLPYKDGAWVTNPQAECGPAARLVKVGNFKSTDFYPNAYDRLETAGVPLSLKPSEFITKIIMQGGFYDPALAGARSGSGLGRLALCVRSIDPNVVEQGSTPPYGNGMVPIGCVVNSRIAGMPAAYAVSAMGAYPQTDEYYTDALQTNVAGPYVYGSELVITTDILTPGPNALSYTAGFTDNGPILQPFAGTLSVSACVANGIPGSGN